MRKTCLAQLEDFLQSRTRNLWLQDRNLAVYVRKAVRLIEGEMVTTLDVASMAAKRPGKGHGTRFLVDAHNKANPFQATFVENVLNPRFAAWLERHGWRHSDQPGCFFMERQKTARQDRRAASRKTQAVA